jgi:DNA mismatch repair protein MutS
MLKRQEWSNRSTQPLNCDSKYRRSTSQASVHLAPAGPAESAALRLPRTNALSLPGVAIKSTPLVAQYLRVKQKVPDAILFFRLGDFYEMFFEDAETASRILDIQLTSRSKDGVPLCGVPYHAVEPYIARLLKAGLKVAICEQESADAGRRGLLAREIVRVITPGTVGEESVLTAGEKNFLAAIAADGKGYALAALDVSTGEFLATRVASAAAAREELARLAPRELLVLPAGAAAFAPGPPAARGSVGRASLPAIDAGGRDARPTDQSALAPTGCTATVLDDAALADAHGALARRFGDDAVASLRDTTPAGAGGDALAVAAGAALAYVERTFGGELAHLRPPRLYRAAEYMTVDETSRRHLELTVSSDGTKQGSLLCVLDETLTPVGARTLSHWVVYPLLDINAIAARHDAVEEFFDAELDSELASTMRRIGDLERLAGRVGSMRASPRDLLALAGAFDAISKLKDALRDRKSALIRDLAAQLDPKPQLAAKITAVLADDPPANARDGSLIRSGFDPQVDELRALATNARGVIAQLESRERDRTKIPSLKVRYNQVFGYYIEVTKPHLERVPSDYERKQTLVGAERFTTPEVKELERKILGAESGLGELELQLFTRLLRDLNADAAEIQKTAEAVGQLDGLISLAKVARRRGYVRPVVTGDCSLFIRDGRHPVLDAMMKRGEFVPNDVEIDPDTRQLLLITGPNMAGKSTYLRQAALIVIMAQMGSFVPATEARIGIIDRVLTRIGARDELRRGESTFMVEMRETARLLSDLTERSLLLLDEVGRGTSTFDGLAIAWAVAEYLHDSTRAKVMFATHFHELTDLARERLRVKNLSMAVREWGGEVLFLRRVVEGGASRSYGIEVARLAGLPHGVIERARQILANLEQGELDESGMPRLARAPKPSDHAQMGLFEPADQRIIDELKMLDADQLTPIEALNILARLTSRFRGES